MTSRIALTLVAVLAVVATAAGLTLLAGGGSGGDVSPLVKDPHGGTIPRAQLDDVLLAADEVGATTPRAELEARGEMLFGSSRVAKEGESCASCHVLGGGVNAALGVITHRRDAGQPVSPDNFTGVRDAPSLWDVAQTAPYNWIGTNRTLDAQAATAIRTHFLPADGAEQADPKAADVAALVAYMRTLTAPVTRHDQGRLSAKELAGEEVFVGKGGCIVCHGGPQFTDNLVHDTDVPQKNVPALGGPSDDPGSEGVPGGFNTPHLRDIRNTAPYMHNGRFETLEDVVDFYNDNPITAGPVGLRLTATEREELVAYLKTL
jgi:cytochrome c peroxidase